MTSLSTVFRCAFKVQLLGMAPQVWLPPLSRLSRSLCTSVPSVGCVTVTTVTSAAAVQMDNEENGEKVRKQIGADKVKDKVKNKVKDNSTSEQKNQIQKQIQKNKVQPNNSTDSTKNLFFSAKSEDDLPNVGLESLDFGAKQILKQPGIKLPLNNSGNNSSKKSTLRFEISKMIQI
jgi:hypothetical protein